MGREAAVKTALARVLIASIGPSASAELRRQGLEPAFEPSHPKMGLLVREAAGR
jgi:uroporphyrinogen-III synthase